jgi:hypothetical protein
MTYRVPLYDDDTTAAFLNGGRNFALCGFATTENGRFGWCYGRVAEEILSRDVALLCNIMY